MLLMIGILVVPHYAMAHDPSVMEYPCRSVWSFSRCSGNEGSALSFGSAGVHQLLVTAIDILGFAIGIPFG
jgi:hypothetical protein